MDTHVGIINKNNALLQNAETGCSTPFPDTTFLLHTGMASPTFKWKLERGSKKTHPQLNK
jgi:hypothetical protein